MSCTEARYSFELYPPRNERAAAALPGTIDRLAAVGPEFISVTFGAGGSSRTASLDVLRYILEHTDVSPMAHLTCVGSSHEEANRLIREFLDAGVRRFLAVRGDPPADLGERAILQLDVHLDGGVLTGHVSGEPADLGLGAGQGVEQFAVAALELDNNRL